MTAEVMPAVPAGSIPSRTSGRLLTGHLAPREFPSARDVLESDLNLLAARLLEQDRRYTMEMDHSVHQMRVACCRLRALLRCYARQFDQVSLRHVDHELSWLLMRLGETRDLEVVHAFVASMPEAPTEEGRLFLGELESFQRSAAWDLRATFSSARYLEVLDLVREPSASLRWRGRSAKAWRAELPPDVHRAYARLRQAEAQAEEAGPDCVDEALHRVRKRVRGLRYATEAIESLDRATYSPAVGRLIAMQNVLGSHHDAVVVEALLRRMNRTSQHSISRAWLKETQAAAHDHKVAAIDAYRQERRGIAALTL